METKAPATEPKPEVIPEKKDAPVTAPKTDPPAIKTSEPVVETKPNGTVEEKKDEKTCDKPCSKVDACEKKTGECCKKSEECSNKAETSEGKDASDKKRKEQPVVNGGICPGENPTKEVKVGEK